ncbi:hypothetical protein J3E68DRAFT_227253 [Trichoderma sp. SZMC 28012]
MFNVMTAVFRTRGMASPRRANQETTAAAGTRRCSAAGDVAQTLQPASGVVNNDVEVLLQLGPAVESSSQLVLLSSSRMIDSCPSIAIIQLAHLYQNGPFLIQVYRILYRKRDAIVSDYSFSIPAASHSLLFPTHWMVLLEHPPHYRPQGPLNKRQNHFGPVTEVGIL